MIMICPLTGKIKKQDNFMSWFHGDGKLSSVLVLLNEEPFGGIM
jgi:hypothetical protein